MQLNRREFLRTTGAAGAVLAAGLTGCNTAKHARRPNILFCITDDHTWMHCSAYGSRFVQTPHFDRLAREGILFNHGFVSVPSCNPSRASALTGQAFYRLKEASMNHTVWPAGLPVYPDILRDAGYHIGFTGKGCMPTDWRTAGLSHDPAGPPFQEKRYENGLKGMEDTNNHYTANFQDFLKARPEGAPFCFWYGAHEPHRVFREGIGLREGKKLSDVELPPFYPDVEEIRSDLLDYAVHIEWADKHLGEMLEHLEKIGELDNTLIVYTGDNGMPFPRCKATCYDMGIHVPLAVRWGDMIQGGRVVDDFVGFADFAPTFLEAAGLPVPTGMTGKSLLPIFKSDQSGRIEDARDHVVVGVERHFPGSRKGGWGYPIRAIRTQRYLYIHNEAAERWPAGDPEGPVWPDDDHTGGFGDVDGSPTKDVLVFNRKKHARAYDLAFGKRPEEELYDVKHDPYQMNNLAGRAEYQKIQSDLRARLHSELLLTLDPRATGEGHLLDKAAVECQQCL